jgi:hypothetical protein
MRCRRERLWVAGRRAQRAPSPIPPVRVRLNLGLRQRCGSARGWAILVGVPGPGALCLLKRSIPLFSEGEPRYMILLFGR